MNLQELEQNLDLAEHVKPDEQFRCYRCDKIAFAAMIVWLFLFSAGVTAFAGWFLLTD